MSLPDPKPGLVIGYAYLWRSEARFGYEEGRKDRPCVVVLAAKRERGEMRVVVAPISHSPPRNGESSIEIPASTGARLKLDENRSWIITSEVNAFAWPGPDVRPADPSQPAQGIVYGYLPSALSKQTNDHIRDGLHQGQTKAVNRSDAARSSPADERLKRMRAAATPEQRDGADKLMESLHQSHSSDADELS